MLTYLENDFLFVHSSLHQLSALATQLVLRFLSALCSSFHLLQAYSVRYSVHSVIRLLSSSNRIKHQSVSP